MHKIYIYFYRSQHTFLMYVCTSLCDTNYLGMDHRTVVHTSDDIVDRTYEARGKIEKTEKLKKIELPLDNEREA